MTGSVLIPVKALVMNILSLGAALGALVWVFQDGHLASLLGFTAFGAIEAWVPVVVFAFAFGLSMDYEVFLLSRITECHDEGCDTNTAVAAGLQRVLLAQPGQLRPLILAQHAVRSTAPLVGVHPVAQGALVDTQVPDQPHRALPEILIELPACFCHRR